MRICVDIWNLLHDGSIVTFSGECPGDISVKVEIEYLCDALATEYKFLWIHLHSCSNVEFTSFENSETVKDFTQLRDCDLEILSAKDEDSHISVCCTDGILKLNYVDATCELANGVSVTFTALSQAYKKYWNDWEQRVK